MNTILDLHDEKDTREQQQPTHLERRFLKVLHWMHCPKCGCALSTERSGPIELNFCPGCRGIWLDGKEIELLMTSGGNFPRSIREFLRELIASREPTER